MDPFVSFHSKIIDIVAEILRLLIIQVEAVKSGRIAARSGTGSFCETVAFTLDHTNLETLVSLPEVSSLSLSFIHTVILPLIFLSTPGKSTWGTELHGMDENSLNYIMNLARTLRTALN